MLLSQTEDLRPWASSNAAPAGWIWQIQGLALPPQFQTSSSHTHPTSPGTTLGLRGHRKCAADATTRAVLL